MGSSLQDNIKAEIGIAALLMLCLIGCCMVLFVCYWNHLNKKQKVIRDEEELLAEETED
jgi:hypothetical protein